MKHKWTMIAGCVAAAGCGCRAVRSDGAGEAATPGGPAVAVPEPGADLDTWRAGHAVTRGEVGQAAPAKEVDLGADRRGIPVALPKPPRGGAAPFTFGDDQHGWVARIPDANQLPSVAYGGGRVFVSGGFESISFYALDAETGHLEWASQNLEDNGPTAPIYVEGRVIFNTESCTLFVMDARSGKK